MLAWVKAAHLVAVIAWMAALLYLPRLMVYHADSAVGSATSETFKVMERRLFRAIATPAMLAAWGFGLWLAIATRAWEEGWFHAKLACVLCLTAFHAMCGVWVKRFADDRNRRGVRFYRLVNELPTVLMIAIVVLVIVRPF
jgi:putative membrane protein